MNGRAEDLAKLVRWFRIRPRSGRDWFGHRDRAGFGALSITEVVAELEATGVVFENGVGNDCGRRVYFWIDSNVATLKLGLRTLGIVEIGFDDPSIGRRKRRTVRRGGIGQ